MKSKEELNTLKEEVETVSRKLAELTEEELEQVTGGIFNLADIESMGVLKDAVAGATIRVRGATSINASNEPLIVVD